MRPPGPYYILLVVSPRRRRIRAEGRPVMVELRAYTDSGPVPHKAITALDMRTAEERATGLLGRFTVHGTVSRVTWTDSATGETSEMEY